MSIHVGVIGAWQSGGQASPALAVEVERAGYGAFWIGGSPPADLGDVERVLEATRTITVATGIVNIWTADARTVAASYHRIEERYPGRFLLGIGVGHPEAHREYQKPYAALTSYLDALRDSGVPADRVALAALGPKVLTLARERTAGATPYLVTPEHTRRAREILGEGPLLMPTQFVVGETDPGRARAIGRPAVERPYLGLRNYTSNLRRLGYTDEDLADGGSDRLVDDLVVYGDDEAIARGIGAHLEAGADHVTLRVLDDDPLPTYRAIASTMLSD